MKFRVLGPLELWDGGRQVALPNLKLQAVLAMLLLEANRPVSRDRLIDALWQGTPPDSAVPTLHSLVYRLRKVFDASSDPSAASLCRTSLGYVLQMTEDATDLHEFEHAVADGEQALENGDCQVALARLRTALSLWRGDPFAGVEVASVREWAAVLEEQRLTAIEALFRARLELGEHYALLSELEAAVSQDPYRERLWELLMTALYRSGRQADALEAYQRLYRLLDDELGIEPCPTVRNLHQSILFGAPELQATPQPPAGSAAPPASSVPRQLPIGVRDFVGRVEQLKALDALLPGNDAHRRTTAAVSVTSGTAGVGKTTLAVEWAQGVADRFPHGQL